MEEPERTIAAAERGPGLELRLERGGAYVALPGQPLLDGVELVSLTMEVPDARLPFDVGAGAAQFRLRLCELDRLELRLSGEGVAAALAGLDLGGSGLTRLGFALRAGFLEGEGALDDGAPFTFKLGLVADEAGDGLASIVHEPRLYAPSALAATLLPARVLRCLAALPWKPLPILLRHVLAPRGFEVPRTAGVRLAQAAIEPGQIRFVWQRGAAAASPADSEAADAAEGAQAFAAAEACLSAGDAAGALAAYRALGLDGAVRPFVAGRVLSLLVADPARHDEALALAGATLRRSPGGVASLLALAQVHAARGHVPFAATALSEAAALCSRRGEESSALAAADACFALGAGADPAARLRAIDVALGLRRDHLPALRALLAEGERSGDRAALLRANRLLAAHAPGAEEKAAAHARLGALLLAADRPAARLHLDHALRLAPRDPATIALLVRVCEEGGEGERAARARGSLEVGRPPAAGERGDSTRRPRPATPPTSDGLEAALERARADPLEASALRDLSSIAQRAAGDPPIARLRVLARVAAGMARFADPAGPAPAPSAASPPPLRLTPELRRAVALPAARGALAQLLAQLAPWLEPLFPADLAARGVDLSHRLGPGRGPGLSALVDEAQRALGARGCVAFLTEGDGCEVQHENTRPPSLVLGGGLARRPPAERRFLVARGLALVDLGWALLGKFSPRDRALLGELACRFAGGSPGAALPPERARAFLEALERAVPAAARSAAIPLAAAAAVELATADPSQLGPALRQTASRWALLHGGDPGAALGALVASERRLRGASHAVALAHPELRDLAAFAISDAFLEARAAVEVT